MDLREETLEIFKEIFGLEKAYKVLEYIDSRVRSDVATQKDIYELKIEIEKVRSNLLKWTFGFWITQMAILVGILLKLLS